jgi:O-antigen ligase
VAVVVFIAFSFSPLILYIPASLQRVFIIFPKEFYSGSLRSLENSAAANSSTFRYEMWKLALPEIAKHPLAGKGFSVPKQTYSFSEEGMTSFQTKSTDILYYDFMAGGQLHNTFVSMAYIMGIPAALIFFAAFIGVIFRTYRYYLLYESQYQPYLKFLLLLLFSSLLSSMLGDLHFDLIFFIFLAIALKTLYAIHCLARPANISPALQK